MNMVKVQVVSGKVSYEHPNGKRDIYKIGDRLEVSERFYKTHRDKFLRIDGVDRNDIITPVRVGGEIQVRSETDPESAEETKPEAPSILSKAKK